MSKMYERSYGYKYAEGGRKSTKDIAVLIRSDIKAAIADGLLPKHYKYSVTSDSFSGGSSININVSGATFVPCPGVYNRSILSDGSIVGTACGNWNCQRNEPGHMILDPEGEAAKMTLERIHGAYNHDGSDAMTDYFDVNYYGHVQFEDEGTAKWKAEQKAMAAAKKAAVEAATDKRKVVVYGRQGTKVHVAAAVDGKLKLICGAQLWRSSSVGSAKDDATVTCSRCAKKEAK